VLALFSKSFIVKVLRFNIVLTLVEGYLRPSPLRVEVNEAVLTYLMLPRPLTVEGKRVSVLSYPAVPTPPLVDTSELLNVLT
jgi:hypothetical protein